MEDRKTLWTWITAGAAAIAVLVALTGNIGKVIDWIDIQVVSEAEAAEAHAPDVLRRIRELESLIISIKYSSKPEREKEEDILAVKEEIEKLRAFLKCLDEKRISCR